VYVADWDSARIYALAADGKVLTHWGGVGTAAGKFEHPTSLTVDRHGHIYVGNDTRPAAQSPGFQVQEFTPRGVFIAGWGGMGPVQLRTPHGIAVDSADNIYVADWEHNRILKFFHDGARPAQWAMSGTGPGQFDHPLAITIDTHDTLYVVDSGGARLQILTTNGAPLAEIHTHLRSLWSGVSHVSGLEETADQLEHLQGLAVDATGYLYLTDWVRSSVVKLNRAGAVIARYTLPHVLLFAGVDSVTVDGAGTVYVAGFWDGHIRRLAHRTGQFRAWM
jgi:sugar lactone lactonase YvrE